MNRLNLSSCPERLAPEPDTSVAGRWGGPCCTHDPSTFTRAKPGRNTANHSQPHGGETKTQALEPWARRLCRVSLQPRLRGRAGDFLATEPQPPRGCTWPSLRGRGRVTHGARTVPAPYPDGDPTL